MLSTTLFIGSLKSGVFTLLSLPALAMALVPAGLAQTPATPPASTSTAGVDPAQQFLARLTPEQQQQFATAAKALKARQFSEALAGFKPLVAQFPGEPVPATYASLAAINSGDPAFAASTLMPISQTSPDDWLVASLLTRACAESGNIACRDAGIKHILDMHRRGVVPANVQEFVIERVAVGPNSLIISAPFEPMGKNNAYTFAQLTDGKGGVLRQITLESPDENQVMFKRVKPQEAAKGVRVFIINGYPQSAPSKKGDGTQAAPTHDVYKFFVGEPSYAVVREQFLTIASGKAAPINIGVEPAGPPASGIPRH